MEKGPAFVFATLMLACSVASVAACSDEDESTFKEGTPDASTDSPGTFNLDSGGDAPVLGDAEPGAKCEPVIPDNYKPSWNAPAKPSSPGPCAAGDLTAYYDECLATLGNPDAGNACDTWKAANAACTSCIEPANNSGPIQWHQQRFYYTLNVAGCIAIKQDAYEEAACGGAYNAAITCEREACAGCFKTGTSTFADFRACQNAASMVGYCKSLETQQASVCTGVKTATETAPCFKDAAEDNKTFFTRAMGIFCGP